MGVQTSKLKSGKDPLLTRLNQIATKYILTQNFKDMMNLRDPKYCDQLILITSDILDEYLTDNDIEYLAQKIKEGVEINEMTKKDVRYLEKKNIGKLNVQNKTKRKRMCIGLAKYYIKAAHVFSAIVTTINPSYSYKDSYGTTIKVPLERKDSIPTGIHPTLSSKLNLCNNRINALINNQDLDLKSDQITVKPKFCSMNLNKDNSTKSLDDEPGISELKPLYNDIYNYETGQYVGMSDTMKSAYKRDLKAFYTTFTGNKSMPDSIKNFSDIKLKDYHNTFGCLPEPNNAFLKAYTGTKNEKYFSEYAVHVQNMINNTNTNRKRLLEILDELFVNRTNPETKEKEIIINPKLTDESLNNLVNKTRNIVVQLYIQCEEEFVKGLEIFEKIIEAQRLEVTQSQMKQLEQSLEKNIANPGNLPSIRN